MKTLNTLAVAATAAAAALLAGHALAHSPSTTDEARAQAAQATRQAALQGAFEPPAFAPVAIGDYRAATANQHRAARFVDFHRELQAHIDGARTPAIAVVSEETARAEAGRLQHERERARQAAYLLATPDAWAEHQDVVQELRPLAQR